MRYRPLLLLPILLFLVACDDTQPADATTDGSMPERIALPGQLSQSDALKAMNENIGSLVPCTKQSKKTAPIDVRLSWNVEPTGKVSQIKLGADPGALDETMRACITDAMSTWTFPASKIGTRIEEIPLKLGGSGS